MSLFSYIIFQVTFEAKKIEKHTYSHRVPRVVKHYIQHIPFDTNRSIRKCNLRSAQMTWPANKPGSSRCISAVASRQDKHNDASHTVLTLFSRAIDVKVFVAYDDVIYIQCASLVLIHF